MATQVVSGDAVKLKCDFQTWNSGVYVDPTGITLKIYDVDRHQIGTTITITSANKTAVGKYEYIWEVPDGYSELIFEYRGEIDGDAILGRQSMNVVFKE